MQMRHWLVYLECCAHTTRGHLNDSLQGHCSSSSIPLKRSSHCVEDNVVVLALPEHLLDRRWHVTRSKPRNGRCRASCLPRYDSGQQPITSTLNNRLLRECGACLVLPAPSGVNSRKCGGGGVVAVVIWHRQITESPRNIPYSQRRKVSLQPFQP
ncbi:hypothetical protein CDEST_00177 [Colletotrichum destructivum]|uniref:Secreted protein n=1 Tax=Colletotrichum destructivum TaxID=34406 RepID=A0AAX4HWC0_9PEZI|nr:hypothetical protein CDEST_00177 [Colletotrichum destructivum]